MLSGLLCRVTLTKRHAKEVCVLLDGGMIERNVLQQLFA